jgi:hypothetical protein
MAFEQDYAGIGVGKTFGVKGLGGVNGQVKTYGKEVQITFEVDSDTVDNVYSATVLNDYIITGLLLNVEEGFGAGATADLSVGGGAGLTTDLNLNTTGVSKPALTGLGNTSGTGPVDIVLDLSDADTQAATTGKATVVVTLERI